MHDSKRVALSYQYQLEETTNREANDKSSIVKSREIPQIQAPRIFRTVQNNDILRICGLNRPVSLSRLLPTFCFDVGVKTLI